MTNKLKSQLGKVLLITFVWTIISIYQFIIGYQTLRQLDCDLESHDPFVFFYSSIVTGILAGVLGGGAIVFVWENRIRGENYGRAILSLFTSYSLIYILVSIGTGFYYISNQLNISIRDSSVLQIIVVNVFSFNNIHNYIFWWLVSLGTLLFLLVNDKYGPGVLWSFLLGRYFQPQREERIFMFLDLRSSTTIAEQLGEVRYFNFIRDVFKDVTPAILDNRGEIYQYVGDEIVVTWKINKGLEDANCIHCFFAVKEALLKRADYYTANYSGISPEFKAGLHYGHVMTGEIGIVKRDIAFSGDVLNTTARIQSKCNELKVDILLSKFLLDRLPRHLFTSKKLANMLLRGKQQEVTLYTLTK